MKSQKLKLNFNYKTISHLPQPLIGVDEVGRGCLAGPVYAGVVVLRADKKSDHFVDSKSISEEKRNDLALEIKSEHYFALGSASVQEVDQYNIRQATFIAMKRAYDELIKIYPEFSESGLVIDGRDIIPTIDAKKQKAIVKGDYYLRCISAASIIAKVERDQLLINLAGKYADYGFEKHKGYGTEYHRKQIEKFGPCAIHRKTFGGVKEYIKGNLG